MPKKVTTHRHLYTDNVYGTRGRLREESFSEGSDYLLDQTVGTQWDNSLNPPSLDKQGQRCTLTGIIQKVRFQYKRIGDPTGSLYCRIRRRSDDVILQTSSNVVDISTISTAGEWIEFPFNLEVVNLEVRITSEITNTNYPWTTGVRELDVGYCGTDVCQGGIIWCTSGYWSEWATYDDKIQVIGLA